MSPECAPGGKYPLLVGGGKIILSLFNMHRPAVDKPPGFVFVVRRSPSRKFRVEDTTSGKVLVIEINPSSEAAARRRRGLFRWG